MSTALPAPLASPVFPSWWPATEPEPVRVTGSLPRITVVTPSFNQASYLEGTIRSVLSQGYPNLEYLVIDGGSRDGSIDIIRHYAAHLAGWVSEPDQGQVDAILKGLTRASGEWFNWINSDDLLAPGALWRVAGAGNQSDAIAGPVTYFSARGLRDVNQNQRLAARPLVFQHLGGTKYHQPGIWLRREALLQTGIQRQRHYKFDYEMLLRYLHRYPHVTYLPQVLAYFRLHEQSKTVTQSAAQLSAFQQEHVDILRELSAEPEFSALRAELELAARQCAWIVELARYAHSADSRWQQLAQLWREVQLDRPARCIRHSRKVALRLLRRGLWPQAWSSVARRKL